jgi:uncharacterized repeat protein (TIGR01451 family)
MKSTLRLLSLLLAGAAFGPPGRALAQTAPTIEFAPGAGNPTANGSSVTDQVITFQTNANNPNDDVFTTLTPTITARFALSNQQYTNVAGGTAGSAGETFGTTSAANGYTGTALFQALNAISNGNGNNISSIYTAAPTNTAGTGINATANRSVWLFTATRALAANATNTSRYQFADLTVTFSQPVSNPVLHISGLGGNAGSGLGFTSELDLVNTPGVSLKKLSGSNELSVGSTQSQILNTFTTLGPATGTGAVSGSIQAITTQPITTLQFRIYLRGDGNGAWYTTDYPGDAWLMGVSLAAPSDVVTTLANVTGASVQAGSPITYTATSQNNGPSAANVSPQVQLPAGLTAAAFTTLPTGASYNNNTGVLTLPTRNVAANGSTSYTFTFTAPNYTTTINGVASSTADVADPTAGNNNGTAANAQVSTTVTLANNNCSGTAYAGAGGSGLYAEYYKGYFADNLGFFSANTAGITRTDGTVNFPATNSWGNLLLPAGNPVATGTVDNPDNYSTRYRGAISIPATGSYTFYLTSDDASYMWIDGAALAATPTLASALIQNGNTHSSITVSATVTLTAGQHNILIFYGEQGGENNLTFEYAGGPGNIARQIVPNSVLCPTQAPSADLATTITGPQTAVVGQTVFYQATTTNLGTDATTNVVPTITLANKPAANTVNVTNGTYNAGTGVVTFNSVNLAANASVVNTVSFVAQASPATATGKAASSSLNSFDPVATNNDGSAANANVTTTVSPTGAAGTPANCAKAGNDGAAPSLAANPNVYYPSNGAQTLTAGTSNSIVVGAARGATTPLAVGDLLLVIQTQGADINSTDTDSYGDGLAGGSANGTSVTSNFTAGTYEYVTVASLSNGFSATNGGTITLTSALKNGYSNAVATTTTGQRTFQVVRVPQYTNVTLTANIAPLAWNGSTGGITVIDVDGQLNLNGFTIDASGRGFRGGAGRSLGGAGTGTTQSGTTYRSSASVNVNGTKGEGIAGTPRYVNDPTYSTTAFLDTRTAVANYPAILPGTLNDGYPSGDNGRGAPGNAGGGGTDATPTNNAQNSGGGGGANGGRGGRGGNSWNSNQPIGGEPGAAFPASSSSRLVLGGGGGAGVTNDGTGTPSGGFASSGTAGGGIVLVRTGTLTGSGSILANGTDNNTSVGNDGSGGAGAGGSILVTVTSSQSSATLTLTANGGKGGNNSGLGTNATAENHGPGGGGGGGVIFTNSLVSATATLNGAANGTTQPGTTAFGAEPGTIGVGNAVISNSIANSTAGANCISDLFTNISGPSSAPAGTTVALQATFSNIGAAASNTTSRTVTLPAGLLNVQATGGTISGGITTPYTITYPATALAPNASNTYNISYTAPASGSVTANSAISETQSSEGGVNSANNTSSVTTAIDLVADVTTALTGPQTLTPGTPSGTYTASFTNEGPSIATTVTRTVTLPAGSTNVTATGSQSVVVNADNTVTITYPPAGTLASGATSSYQFSFTPATSASGSLAITSNVSTTTSQGNNNAPDASTITAPVVPLANVATTITTSTPSIAAGSAATGRFRVTFSNGGPSPANGVVASVQLPAGLTNVTATNGGSYSPTTGLLTFPGLTSITNGGSVTSDITFDAPTSGPVVASSAISTTTNEAGQTANNAATAAVAINPAFDLTTTLTGPTTAVVGDLVTLAVTTTNNGPSPAPNAVQTVQLTSGLTNVYVSNGGVYNPSTTAQNITSNGVTYSQVPAGGVVFPTVASLASGQTVANSISFTFPASNTTGFAPTALVTPNTTAAGETNTNNNTAALNNTSGATLATVNPQTGTSNAYTTITTSTASTSVGSPVTLTVVTGNNGPNRATGVTQTVQLLPGFTTGTLQVNGVTGTAGTNSITFGTTASYNTLTGLLTFQTLTDGANGSASATSVSNTITITPSAATATTVATTGSNGQILAMAAVRTTNTDPVPADNVSSVAVTLLQAADLATTISGPTAVQPGQSVTYTATYVNNGPMDATGVTETAQLPAGLGANSVTITDGNGNAVSGASYNSTTGLVTFPTLTTSISGARQVFRLTFLAPNQGFTALSSVGSTTPDVAIANNTASTPVAVAAAADLATVVNGPATAVVGNSVTYTVSTTNNGPVTATNATTTLQLAAGFSAATLTVNGTTGVASGNNVNYTLPGGATATYNTQSGLVTFPVVAGLPNGGIASNYVTFVMPANPTNGQTAGVASVSFSGADPVSGNNTASVATSIAPTTFTSADLVATVSASATSVAPGTSVTFTASYSNIGTDAAANVVPTLQLLPGLTTATIPLVSGGTGTANGNIITFSNGTTYNSTTGIVSFPPIASQAAGTSGNVSYTVQVTMPNNGPVLATAATTSNTSEPNTTAAQANNVQSVPVTITPSFNEVTSISGPTVALAGSSQTYTVTTTNNGPSATSNATTQTVTVPAGQTPTNITNGGVYSSANNNITWTIPAGQGPGGSNAVANSFTIVQPTTSTTLNAAVTVTGESNSGDNTASIKTDPLNLAPLAYAVVNSLQNPQSNEAGGLATGLFISPLVASDPENAFATAKYTVVAAPDASQGTLYYNNNGTYTQVNANQTLTQAQAQTLRFKAATNFAGNASFTYLTTDAAGNTSPVVNYTIPVETDVDAVAYTLTPQKGGSGSPTPYVAGDVIAFTTDANGAVYNASTAAVYTNTGVLQSGANNGIVAASVVAGSFTSSRTGITSLAGIGLVLDATGRIVVDAAPNTSKLQSGSYSVQILTTDGNGGQTTRIVSFIIPGNPLPVVLTTFTATAVGNRDAQLAWTTASEVNSAYFDVERSFDGVTFTKVGQVAAQGTTAASTTYAFTDRNVASRTEGAAYYRLRQVDLDATATYSPVRTVSFTKATAATLSLYPNPAQLATGLDLRQLPANGTYQVQLLDATGRLVRAASLAGGQLQPLNLTDLATGTYHVLVTGTQPDGSTLRQTLRLTKE